MRLRHLVIAATVVLPIALSAQTPKFRTLYGFPAEQYGEYPWAGVIEANGKLYGTTEEYGLGQPGVVFEMDSKSGSERVIHSFIGSDGAYPFSPVIRDSEGNLYGTTEEGGAYSVGAVYEISSSGTETVLHSFSWSTTDGCIPAGGLVEYKGALYGAASNCGAYSKGAIFKVTKTGKETLLHSFAGGSFDGASPGYTGLLVDKRDGTFYSVTATGGVSNNGTLYKMTEDGKVDVLHSFAGGKTDGCGPQGTPVFDKKKNIYGTTVGCGAHRYGTLWKATPEGKETILRNFPDRTGDGKYPDTGVAFDAKGNIYGTTAFGGTADWGVVFELRGNGRYTVLHSFIHSFDGACPEGQVLVDGNGHLYGTTFLGGDYGFGTVWEYVP